MRFLCDEDTDADIAEYLSKEGHDVERVVTVEELGSGSDDAAVMRYARSTIRTILTHDSDYTDPGLAEHHCGVFYVPDQRKPAIDQYRVVSGILEQYSDREDMPPVVFLTDEWL